MEEENVLQRLRDHLCVVPFDTDRKHFRMAIREIERLQSIVDSYKKEYPYREWLMKRTSDA